MNILHLYFLGLLILFAPVPRAEVPAGNIWPNPTFETGDSLELVTGLPTGWSRGGNMGAICQVSMEKAISPSHSLALNDTEATGYGEWYADLLLAGLAGVGDDLDLQWNELFNISGGEMRLTLLFFNSTGGVILERHFVATGQSAGWAGTVASSPFAARTARVAIPEGAAKIRFALVSGGSEATTGVMLVDDLSVVRHGNPILLANNFWPNPSFELGENLGQLDGTVANWSRGGNGPVLCEVTIANSVSPSHSLLVNDTDPTKYAEWYSDLVLAGHAAPGDEVDLQWFQMFNVTGEMRLTVLFFNAADNVAGTFHFTVNGASAGWTGTLADSPFAKRNERIPVAAGAVKMRIALVSGGAESVTGFLMIDDLSVARVAPPLAQILAGNFRGNPTFEEGQDLNLPTGTLAGWSRGGSDATIDQVSAAASVSASHSLALVDNNAAGYGEWYSDEALPCAATPGHIVNLQWFQVHNISGGDMRVSVLFFNGAGGVVSEHHYTATGQSAGWTGLLATSPFAQKNEQVVVPAGAVRMRFALVSGGAESVTGTMLIDNFSASVEPTAPTLLFGSVWPNGSFEAGANMEQSAQALPTGWQRGGSDAAIDIVTTVNSASSTHALAVLDNNAAGYGEWYASVDLAGRAVAGDLLKLQWFELFNIANGEMRFSLLFFDVNNAVVGERHFAAQGSSAGWAGDLPCSTFSKRNEEITVPAGAVRMQAALVSGGPAATTGVMVIDDFSMAKPLPPPLILARNFWVNSTFEAGAQLDNVTAGVPDGWNRGGSDSRGDVVFHDKATSPTHSLGLRDTNATGYSEWYASASLSGIAVGGDSIDVQWQQVYDTTGTMRLTILFFDAVTGGNVVGERTFSVSGQSPDWTGDLATSPFELRNERILVADGAMRMQIGLASGGGPEVTGTLIIDDLSLAVVTADSDGDGMSDADETLAGTDPGNALSRMNVISAIAEGAGRRITWSSVPGKTYAVQFAETPVNSAFASILTGELIPAAAVGSQTSFLDLTVRPATTGFYRIQLVP